MTMADTFVLLMALLFVTDLSPPQQEQHNSLVGVEDWLVEMDS